MWIRFLEGRTALLVGGRDQLACVICLRKWLLDSVTKARKSRRRRDAVELLIIKNTASYDEHRIF